jgi:hypothetical protein
LAQVHLAAAVVGRDRAILLERPIAGDLAGAEELAEVAPGRKVVSQVGLAWRYSADVRRFLTEARRIQPTGGNGRLISAVPTLRLAVGPQPGSGGASCGTGVPT